MELISREEAVKKLGDDHFKNYGNAIMIILDLPTVEERKEGRWIDNGDRYYRCSLCGMKDTDNWTFCRGCGARMKGE